MVSQSDGPRTIKSVEVSYDIIEEIRKRDGAGITEIAEALGISKSSSHHHVSTLMKRNFLKKIDGQYQIGTRFLTYGGHARQKEEVFETSRRDVDELARKTGEIARLVVENDGYGFTLYQSVGGKVSDPHTHVGMEEHLHSSAGGKAFLAALPRKEVKAIIDERGLEQSTSNTITTPTELHEELEHIRSHGIAFDDEEEFNNIRGIATTLTSESGDLLGSVSISAPRRRMSDHRFRTELPEQLQKVAEKVNRVDEYRFRHDLPCISRTLSQ